MPIEIEKKYRLTKRQRQELQRRLPEIGAIFEGDQFEENTLYQGGALDPRTSVLRLRRLSEGADNKGWGRAVMTYKQRFSSSSTIKKQREDETEVADGEAMESILDALGFAPALVYEKRRATWHLGDAEIVIDELPFGNFMEIEGSESDIRKVQRHLAVKGLRVEHATYPQLTERNGEIRDGIIEARFKNE